MATSQVNKEAIAQERQAQAPKRGLILVNTGDGKGKTTAALGVALRAWGQGLRVLILQFIKSGSHYGELKGIAQLGKGIEIRPMGNGFIFHNKEAS